MKTDLIYANKLPHPSSLASVSILIYDKYLQKNPSLNKWIEQFSFSLPVKAGENLKQLNQFEKHLLTLLKIVEKAKTKNITIVALGGGSLGDFAGFLASVFKRGVPLIHIPSTWLSAIDSSHGGKTALNVAGYKNQIGTFYPANKIYIIKNLLLTQPQVRLADSMGEVLKTILINGGHLWD
ncbi:MAG: hypothetical protein KDD45_05710, partial [Bdellovibrionales bacterium]|nr:hypothetical protein [Bdellovibrionales bacterium]